MTVTPSFMSLLLSAHNPDMHEMPCKVGLKTGLSHLLPAGVHLETFACACVRVCSGASKELEMVLNANS